MLQIMPLIAAHAISSANEVTSRQDISSLKKTGQYIAYLTPSQSPTLNASDICTSNKALNKAFVDPVKLKLQLLYQYKAYDALSNSNINRLNTLLDGSTSRYRKGGILSESDITDKPYCDVSIIIQRLLLGFYPGFNPNVEQNDSALNSPASLNNNEHSSKIEAKLVHNIPHDLLGLDLALSQSQRDTLWTKYKIDVNSLMGQVVDDFLNSNSDTHVNCESLRVDRTDQHVIQNGVLGNTLRLVRDERGNLPNEQFEYRNAHLGFLIYPIQYTYAQLKLLQWRQVPGNLIYKTASSSVDKSDATFATGQDLYDSDSGFGISMSRARSNPTATKPPSEIYSTAYQGAVGLPVCGLTIRKDCSFSFVEPFPSVTADFVPYFAVDHESTKTSYASKLSPVANIAANQQEFGAVEFLNVKFKQIVTPPRDAFSLSDT